MHIWVVEVKEDEDSNWDAWSFDMSRDEARKSAKFYRIRYADARVVKYISTKGE